ncbi:unnamed protein product [Anisakis simplex]|uniref:Phage protein n=1 Tax=Anisakis simplex TaxID=6269 RepID=A0A0M3K6S1_ANISI|nr:unnamed protein product [Anisakis simplex]
MSIANGIEIDPWSVFAERLDVPSGSTELTINASNTSLKQSDAVECDIIRRDSLKTLPELWLSKRPLNDNHWRWLCDVGDMLETEYEVDFGENWLDSVTVHLRSKCSLEFFRHILKISEVC